MSRQIKVAAIQLDGTPAPKSHRLDGVASKIRVAVADGANLIVLPALFNTGKTFLETNYEATERLSDETMQWMRQQAQEHDVHIAGSWMVVENDDTYHMAFLIDPQGQSWRYNQTYPQLWERAFYRDGNGITVADTELGKIGFMIGWDVAHPDLWERYAAKLDCLLILHSELDMRQATLRYDDGRVVHQDKFSLLARWFIDRTRNYLSQDIPKQIRWLQVPTVCVGASGHFQSILPAPFFSAMALLFGQSEWGERAQDQYAQIQLFAPFAHYTQIFDAQGNALASSEGNVENIIVADITLPDRTPLPLDQLQPEMVTSETLRFISNLITNGLFTLIYRRGVRRQWGARMAPIEPRTRIWLRVLMIGMLLSAIVGRWILPKRC